MIGKQKVRKFILTLATALILVYLCAPLYSNYRLDIENQSPVLAEIEVRSQDGKNKIINKTKKGRLNIQQCPVQTESCLRYSKQLISKSSSMEIKLQPEQSGDLILAFKLSEPSGQSSIKLVYKNLSIDKQPFFSKIKIGHSGAHYEKIRFEKGRITTIRVKVEKNYKIKVNMLISIMILAYLVSYKALQYMSKFKISEKNSRIDIVFVIIFCGLLFLPMSNISTAQKSAEENRMLAASPSLFNENMLNNKYGNQFESWFNDHFFGRKFLLKIYKNKPASRENDKVFEGLDNWIFLKEDNSIRNFQNLDLFSEGELKSIGTYLSDIHHWAEQNGKNFYMVIPADKNKIYGEFYPVRIKKINPDNQSRANQLVSYMNKNYPEVRIIYLQETMLKNKDKGLLYWKNDTHWNDLGAYYGYQALMEIITKDYPNQPISYEQFESEEAFPGMMMGLGNEKIYNELKYKATQKKYNCYEVKNSYTYKTHECKNPSNTIHAFLFRDSFSGEPQTQVKGWLPYLYESFGTINIKWQYGADYNDMQKLQISDIVVLEILERNLPHLINLNFPKE